MIIEWPGVVGAASAVMVPVAGVLWALNKSTFEDLLSKSNNSLMERINGTYVRSAGSKLTGDEIGRRLNAMDDRFDRVELKLDRITGMIGRLATGYRHAQPPAGDEYEST